MENFYRAYYKYEDALRNYNIVHECALPERALSLVTQVSGVAKADDELLIATGFQRYVPEPAAPPHAEVPFSPQRDLQAEAEQPFSVSVYNKPFASQKVEDMPEPTAAEITQLATDLTTADEYITMLTYKEMQKVILQEFAGTLPHGTENRIMLILKAADKHIRFI